MKSKLLLLTVAGMVIVAAACKKTSISTQLAADFGVSSQQVLAGDSVVFSDLSDGQPSTWHWEFEGGTPATSNLSGPTVVYNVPGSYAVSLEIRNVKTSSVEKKTGFITVSYKDVVADFDASALSVNQDETVTFTDKSTGMPNQWSWEFKSGTTVLTSTEQNPAIKFTIPGTYTVTLIATNPKGSDTLVKADLIKVVDITAVEAQFEGDFTATYTGGSIQFTDKSIGTASTWNWTFEGASTPTSTTQNPTVTYNNPGRYKVTLVASNTARSSTIEKEGYILVVPGNGLSAFYPFNGNTNDVGPNRVPSNAQGTITYSGSDRKALPDRVGRFDGSSLVFVPDHSAMNFGTGNFSISCWIKTDQTKRMMVWMESGVNGSRDNQTWLRLGDNTTDRRMRFTVEDANGGTILNVGAEGDMSNNNWHHVVCVRDGLKSQIYVDGVLVREGNAPNVKDVSNAAGFKIGAQESATGFNTYFTGSLDDVIIYKRALTQAEVTELKNL